MRRKSARVGVRMVAGLVCMALLMLAVVLLVEHIDRGMQVQELETLREQVRRAAVSCYASEGRYPMELAYLEEHYGLIVDHTRYSILYDAFASNVMPDIEVTVRGEYRP